MSAARFEFEAVPPRVWTAVCLVVLVVAVLLRYAVLLGGSVSVHAPTRSAAYFPGDHKLVVAIVADHARVLIREPLQLFALKQCHPMPDALALGEPMLTSGLLGVPAALVTDEPVAIFNFALVAGMLAAALSMFWLVRDWTGSPTAGLVAGLLFSLLGTRTFDPVHIYSWDTTWMVLALLFSRRLFESGRWRDAAGLLVAAILQMGSSFYPLFGCALLAMPYGVWLVATTGLRRVPWPQLGVVLIGTAAFAALLFGPYLSMRAGGELAARSSAMFLAPESLYPGAIPSPGLLGLGLALLALWPRFGRRGDVRRGHPALALAIGTLIVVAVSTSPQSGTTTIESAVLSHMFSVSAGFRLGDNAPLLYSFLAQVVPGVEVVRFPAGFYAAGHMAICLLAGLGAASLLRAWPVHGLPLRIALVAAAIVSVTIGALPYERRTMRPDEPTLEFYRALERAGNDGPILELPAKPRSGREGTWVDYTLLAAYHGRRTSNCYNSFVPPATRGVRALARRLPDPGAIVELRALGFTTAVLHHPAEAPARRLRDRLDEAASGPRAHLRVLRRTEDRTAYELLEESGGTT